MKNEMLNTVVKEISASGADLALVLKKLQQANTKLEARIRKEQRLRALEQAG
jgi:uncharacterized membrane protein